MIKEDRRNTLKMMVRNYYGQVEIVNSWGKEVIITLQEYLNGIGIMGEDMEFALEYGKHYPKRCNNLNRGITKDIFEQSKNALKELINDKDKIKLYINNVAHDWLIAEDNQIVGEFTIGLKYLHISDKEYMPINEKDLEDFIIIANMFKYTYRLPVPREMRAGYVLVFEPM